MAIDIDRAQFAAPIHVYDVSQPGGDVRLLIESANIINGLRLTFAVRSAPAHLDEAVQRAANEFNIAWGARQ